MTMLPAPCKPRRYRIEPVERRANRLRKWLALGPQTIEELCDAMECSRFALSFTLRSMQDVVRIRGADRRVRVTLDNSERLNHSNSTRNSA